MRKYPLSTQRAALIASSLTSFIAPFMSSSVNVALPSMGRELGLGEVFLGWINMAFLLTAASFSIPFGRVGDVWGRKRVYMTGIAVFTAASTLAALAGTGTEVVVCRALQGFGSSMIFATGMAILVSVYPAEERGRVLGINVASVYMGLSSGPFAGGIITEYLGWRFIFWLNLPVGLLLLAVIFAMLKGEWSEEKGSSFDYIGSAILIVSLSSTIFAFSRLLEPFALIVLAMGLSGLAVFALFELRVEHPLIDVRLFRQNRVFAFSNLAALMNYAATFAVGFLLSLYLQKIRGLSPRDAGVVLVCQPFVQALLSPMAGRLSDRVEPRTVASIGMGLSSAGIALLYFVDRSTPIPCVVGCLMLLGLGFALFSSPNTKAVMGSVDRNMYGVASAVVGTMRQIGMTLSMGVVMMILTIHLGESTIEAGRGDAFIDAMRSAFAMFAVVCFLGIFASLARGRTSSAAERA